MAGQHQQMNGLLSQLKGRIPMENMPPGGAGGDDDEDVQPGSLAGQKEGAFARRRPDADAAVTGSGGTASRRPFARRRPPPADERPARRAAKRKKRTRLVKIQMGNIQHSTANPERRNFFEARLSGLWVLNVECSMLNVLILLLLLAPVLLPAQTQPSISTAVAAQLVMRPQPPVDNSQFNNVTATAEFDPPVVRPGEKTFYRVSITAMGDSIEWPEVIGAPAALPFIRSTHGQLTQSDGAQFHPLTVFIYEAIPAAAGHFVISNFSIFANGRSLEIPAAGLDVAENAAPHPAGTATCAGNVGDECFSRRAFQGAGDVAVRTRQFHRSGP